VIYATANHTRQKRLSRFMQLTLCPMRALPDSVIGPHRQRILEWGFRQWRVGHLIALGLFTAHDRTSFRRPVA
jgi:hypothetical protein